MNKSDHRAQLDHLASRRGGKFDAKDYVDKLIEVLHESPDEFNPDADAKSLLPGGRRATIRAGRGPYVFSFLAHLARFGQLQGVSLHNSAMADQFSACFTYENYRFAIDMFWGGELDIVAAPEVPDDVFERVLEHLRHTPLWLWRALSTRRRFTRLPQWPPDSWWA